MCTGSGGGLSPEQNAQLQAMLKATKAPATSIPALLMRLGGVPRGRSSAFNLAVDARQSIMRRQGYKDTVKTSSLGDAGFGKSVATASLGGVAA